MPPTFQKIEPVSKKARIVAQLREAIISGNIQAGEQIVEGKIAQQFGVGQGLIREALIELEHHGFFLAGGKAGPEDLETLKEIAEKTRAASKAEDLDAFFEHHLNFR